MNFPRSLRALVGVLLLSGIAACSSPEPVEVVQAPEPVAFVEGYGPIIDNGYALPGVPPEYLEDPNFRKIVLYSGDEKPGTIEIDPHAKFLYFIEDDGTAIRYPIAVGRQGRSMRGTTVIRRKEEWPGWTPTNNMLRREPDVYGPFARGIPGGLRSPLGARALYLYVGSRDTMYRIHGTNDLASIGNSGSAGCIRLFNHDVIDLYERVPNGTRVVVRTLKDSIRLEGEEYAARGEELEATRVDPDLIYSEEAILADRPIAAILADELVREDLPEDEAASAEVEDEAGTAALGDS